MTYRVYAVRPHTPTYCLLQGGGWGGPLHAGPFWQATDHTVAQAEATRLAPYLPTRKLVVRETQ